MENLVFVIYFIIAAGVVLFSIKCAQYVDLLDKKSNISGAFIGGIILAAVTALPELITSISAIFIVDNTGLIAGNILGSNMFNLAVLGMLTFFTVKQFSKASIAKSHLKTLICSGFAYLLAGSAIVFDIGRLPYVNINAVSFLILISYIISFRYLSAEDSQTEDDSSSKLTIKQIITRFVLVALGLVLFSVLITYVTDIIADRLELEVSLAGALFLGVVTSLPELTSSITLVRKRNYNAMLGNIIGSNMFNFMILFIADVLTPNREIYLFSEQTFWMLLFGFLATIFVGTILAVKRIEKNGPPKGIRTFYLLASLITVGSYAAFLALSA